MDIVFFLELEKVKLYQDSLSIGNGMLYGNFYRSELYGLPHIFVSVNTVSSTKRLRLNEKSSILWHKLLGHISKHIIERLIKDEILLNLDFSYFNTCVDCIKGNVAPLSRPDLLGRIRTETGMPLKSLHHSKSYLCGSDYKIGQAHKPLHLTKSIYNEGIQAFSK